MKRVSFFFTIIKSENKKYNNKTYYMTLIFYRTLSISTRTLMLDAAKTHLYRVRVYCRRLVNLFLWNPFFTYYILLLREREKYF